MMSAAELATMRGAMLELADRAECISELFPGRALWGAVDSGVLNFCIAPPPADRELLADNFLDSILLTAHTEAAVDHVRHVGALRAALSTKTRQ